MASVKSKDITLDSQGISSILTGGEVTAMVHEVAQNVAGAVEASIPAGSSYWHEPRGRVTITYYTAGGGKLIGQRSAALVVVAFVRGAAVEARYGALHNAVAAQGLRVRTNRGGR